jgi:pimeloyl-ACP methyl ester carboxylesterase
MPLPRWSVPVAAGLAIATAACATPPPDALAAPEQASPAAADAAAGTVVTGMIELAGQPVGAVWYLPAGEPAALVLVQHGFTRRCANVDGTARRFMAGGAIALCLEASMTGGNPALAEALAAAIAGGLTAPGGALLPDRVVVGGHSAGGLFASRVGWALAAAAPQRLAGAVLFDPVSGSGFTENLMAVSAAGERPVLAVTANPGPCNAQNNAYPALRQLRADAQAAGRDGFVGVQLTDRSTHVDVEGADTNRLGVRACAQGWPRRANTEALRTLAVQWALDAAAAVRTPAVYPGGGTLDALIAAGDAEVID